MNHKHNDFKITQETVDFLNSFITDYCNQHIEEFDEAFLDHLVFPWNQELRNVFYRNHYILTVNFKL